MAETLVLMGRFDFEKMLEAVERYKVTYMPVSPPLVVALEKSELTQKYDLSSLEYLGCGGAPLGKEVAQRCKARFPNVEIGQVLFRNFDHPVPKMVQKFFLIHIVKLRVFYVDEIRS